MDDDDNVGDGPDDLRPLILVLRYEGLSLMIFYIYMFVCVCVHNTDDQKYFIIIHDIQSLLPRSQKAGSGVSYKCCLK